MNTEIMELLNSYRDSDGDIGDYDLSEEFDVVDESDWTQEHKYQFGGFIALHKPTKTYWDVRRSRSGSYHSDWYYDAADVCQVEPHDEVITKTVRVWKEVK
ncbi:MAG: hypothetical protein ACRC6V_12185 [Bacteroidales bacterium]